MTTYKQNNVFDLLYTTGRAGEFVGSVTMSSILSSISCIDVKLPQQRSRVRIEAREMLFSGFHFWNL